MLILGYMNRADGALKVKLDRLFLSVGALLLTLALTFILEYSSRSLMHGTLFYRAVCLAVPALLLGIGSASHQRWACTMMAGIYTAVWLAGLWIFPLFPAEAKLGPVFNRITHMIPLNFPLLIVAPALAVDLVNARFAGGRRWLHALAAGSAFLVVFAAAQWPFASFLMTPAARNWVFGTHYFNYMVDVTRYKYAFDPLPGALELSRGVGLALLAAVLTSRLGLALGAGLRRLQR
jgi:hypothetical protein